MSPAGPDPDPAPSPGGREGYRDAATRVEAEQLPGLRVVVRAAGLLPLPASTVFSLLTHPKNEQIFRHLVSCTERTLLHDGGGGRVALESVHLARWRLLALTGQVTTRLRVEQDPGAATVAFALLPGPRSLLRTFDGRWRVTPAPSQHCSHLRGGDPRGPCSLLQLQQEVQPALPLPPPLGRALQSIACRQVRGIYEDLAAEAARIREGRPTLWPREGGGGARPSTHSARQ